MKCLPAFFLLVCLACKRDHDTVSPAGIPAPAHYTYLALGDSYTIGESVQSPERFPNQLFNALNQHPGLSVAPPLVIAKTGWTTGNLLDALARTPIADTFGLVTLLIGVNNQYQGRDTGEYATQFEALLVKAIGYAGGNAAHVFVLSIPNYGYTPFGERNRAQITEEIIRFNAINHRICNKFGVTRFNITPISENTDSSLVAGDGLHPSGKQYGLWVQLMYEAIQKHLLVP